MLYRIGTTSLTSCKKVNDVNQCLGGLGCKQLLFSHRFLTSFSSLDYFEVNRMNTISLLFIKILSRFCTSNNHIFYSYIRMLQALRMYGFLGVWMCGHCDQEDGRGRDQLKLEAHIVWSTLVPIGPAGYYAGKITSHTTNLNKLHVLSNIRKYQHSCSAVKWHNSIKTLHSTLETSILLCVQ